MRLHPERKKLNLEKWPKQDFMEEECVIYF